MLICRLTLLGSALNILLMMILVEVGTVEMAFKNLPFEKLNMGQRAVAFDYEVFQVLKE